VPFCGPAVHSSRLGAFPGGEYSEATAVNDLGDVVGASNTETAIRAFRWTGAAGLNDLGVLPGDVASQAFAVNHAGAVAGFSTGPNGTRAVIWDRASGVQNLGTLPGGNFSVARA
jgi:probable HAF family extracellular repeat protein